MSESAAVAVPEKTSAAVSASDNQGFTPPVNLRAQFAKYEKAAEEKAGTTNATDSGSTGPSVPAVDAAGATAASKLVPSEPKSEQTATKVDGDKVAALLKAGDWEGALKLAGVDPEGTKIPASRWAEFRKHEKEFREKARVTELRLQQRDNEVRNLAATVAKQFEPFQLAKKAWDSGNIEDAIKHAFGADLTEFSELAVKHKLGQDPEVIALKRWKAEQEKAAQERAEAEAKALAEQTTAAQRREYCAALAIELKDAGATIAAAAETFPDFTQRVMQIQLDAYNKSGEELSAAEAAGKLIDQLKPWLEKWSKVMGVGATPNPQSSDGAATTLQSTAQAGKSPEKSEKQFTPKKKAQPAPPVPDADFDDEQRRKAWKQRLIVAAREDGLVPR